MKNIVSIMVFSLFITVGIYFIFESLKPATGVIDNFSVWNRALTQEEIAKEYQLFKSVISDSSNNTTEGQLKLDSIWQEWRGK